MDPAIGVLACGHQEAVKCKNCTGVWIGVSSWSSDGRDDRPELQDRLNDSPDDPLGLTNTLALAGADTVPDLHLRLELPNETVLHEFSLLASKSETSDHFRLCASEVDVTHAPNTFFDPVLDEDLDPADEQDEYKPVLTPLDFEAALLQLLPPRDTLVSFFCFLLEIISFNSSSDE